MTVHLMSFTGLCLLITITPGLDTAVVVRSTMKSGRSAGMRTALGCAEAFSCMPHWSRSA